MNLIKAEEIFDSLLNEKLFGYKLPAWVDTNIYTKLKEISDKTFIFDAMTREIQKFRAGLLLADIWQHISNHELLDNDDDYCINCLLFVNIFLFYPAKFFQ